jgi:hypothetical protein
MPTKRESKAEHTLCDRLLNLCARLFAAVEQPLFVIGQGLRELFIRDWRGLRWREREGSQLLNVASTGAELELGGTFGKRGVGRQRR